MGYYTDAVNNTTGALNNLSSAVIKGVTASKAKDAIDSHLKNQEEIKESIDSWKNQYDLERDMKPAAQSDKLSDTQKEYLTTNFPGAGTRVAETPEQQEALKKFGKEWDEKISKYEEENKFSPEENAQLDQWINAETPALQEIMAERALESSNNAVESSTTTRGNFESIREAAKSGEKVRPYVIIKGTGRAKKKYLD